MYTMKGWYMVTDIAWRSDLVYVERKRRKLIMIQYLKDEEEINVQREIRAKTLVPEKMQERHMAGSQTVRLDLTEDARCKMQERCAHCGPC